VPITRGAVNSSSMGYDFTMSRALKIMFWMSFNSKSILLPGALFCTDRSYLIILSTSKSLTASLTGSLFDYLLSSDLLDFASLSEEISTITLFSSSLSLIYSKLLSESPSILKSTLLFLFLFLFFFFLFLLFWLSFELWLYPDFILKSSLSDEFIVFFIILFKYIVIN